MGERSGEKGWTWWSCLWCTLLILSLVMAIAALWLPLDRHLTMDIAIDRLRNRSDAADKRLETLDSDFTQIRTQVLRLEQERRGGGGGAGVGNGGLAREIEELKKLLIDTFRKKDLEINHLKAQVQGGEERLGREVSSLRRELEQLAAIQPPPLHNSILPTLGKLSEDHSRVQKDVESLRRSVREIQDQLRAQDNSMSADRSRLAVLEKSITRQTEGQQGEVAFLTSPNKDELVGLELDLTSLNSSFLAFSAQVTEHISTLLQKQDNLTESGNAQSLVVAGLGQRLEEQAGKIWEMETELENFLLENTGLQGRIEELNKQLSHQILGNITGEISIIVEELRQAWDERLETLSTDLRAALTDVNSSLVDAVDQHQGEMARKLGSLEEAHFNTSLQLESIELERKSAEEKTTEMEHRLTGLVEKVNHFLQTFLQLKQLPMQMYSLANRLDKLESMKD